MAGLLNWSELKLVKTEDINYQVRSFQFEFVGKASVDFKAGQFVTFDLPISDKKKDRLRSYSIASAPDGKSNSIELIIVYVPDGKGTNYLFNTLQVGDSLQARGPLGNFVLPEDINNEIYFICTGTGIAPFRSMLLDLKNKGIEPPKPMHIIFGSRKQEDLLCRKEMENLANNTANMFYRPTLSREDWEGHKGYVHKVYEDLIANSKHEDKQFYLCGWRNMIDEARKRLKDLGIDRKKIHFELYG